MKYNLRSVVLFFREAQNSAERQRKKEVGSLDCRLKKYNKVQLERIKVKSGWNSVPRQIAEASQDGRSNKSIAVCQIWWSNSWLQRLGVRSLSPIPILSRSTELICGLTWAWSVLFGRHWQYFYNLFINHQNLRLINIVKCNMIT